MLKRSTVIRIDLSIIVAIIAAVTYLEVAIEMRYIPKLLTMLVVIGVGSALVAIVSSLIERTMGTHIQQMLTDEHGLKQQNIGHSSTKAAFRKYNPQTQLEEWFAVNGGVATGPFDSKADALRSISSDTASLLSLS